MQEPLVTQEPLVNERRACRDRVKTCVAAYENILIVLYLLFLAGHSIYGAIVLMREQSGSHCFAVRMSCDAVMMVVDMVVVCIAMYKLINNVPRQPPPLLDGPDPHKRFRQFVPVVAFVWLAVVVVVTIVWLGVSDCTNVLVISFATAAIVFCPHIHSPNRSFV
jgi:uncharacterized membrane protein YozB (DUF420 family)